MLKEPKLVNDIIGLNIGVSSEDDCLLVTHDYANRAISTMNEAIMDLIEGVNQ